jgi:hypothetical protein
MDVLIDERTAVEGLYCTISQSFNTMTACNPVSRTNHTMLMHPMLINYWPLEDGTTNALKPITQPKWK